MTIKNKIRKSFPYSMGSAAVQTVFSLFGMVLLVRYLEPKEYGIWAILSALPGMINLFISFGYQDFITRYVPSLENSGEISKTIWAILMRRFILTLIVLVPLVLTFNLYAHKFDIEDYYVHFMVYQIAVLFSIGYIYLSLAFNARFMQKQVLILSFVYQTLILISTIVGIYMMKQLIYFISAFAVCSFINFILGALLFNQYYKFSNGLDMLRGFKDSEEQKRYRRTCYINNFGTSFLGTDIDRYILAYYSNNVQVAIYAVATTVIKKCIFFLPHSMFKPLVEPSFYSKYDSSGKESDINTMFQFLFNVNNMVGFLFLSLFLPLGKDMLNIVFKSAYIEAYYPIIVFMIFMILYSIPLGMVVKAIRKPKILIISKITVLMNIILGIPLAIYFGALGMAVATASSVIAKNMIIYFYAKRSIELNIPWISTVKCIINTIVTMIIVYSSSLYMPIVICIILGVLSYLLCLRINPVFTSDQKNMLVSIFPHKIIKFVVGAV